MLLLHLSDIHFKKTEIGEPDDPNLALRSDIIKDVKRMREKIGKPSDGILLTGDIAFAGHPAEYDFAYQWLEEKLCPAAGCRIEDVFVIPGNHDVDRNVETDPAQLMAREALRGKRANEVNGELRKWMRGKIASTVIFGPIQNYNRFAAKFLCPLRPYIDDDGTGDHPARPFACRDVPLNDGSTLRMWGFNTVLVSDDKDDERRMLIDPAAAQIEEEDGVCHMVMAHHPFNWLKNGKDFEDRCNLVAKIQLFGHEHTRRIDEGKRYLRIRAGAMHPERDESDWKPGYNWIDIAVDRVDGKRKLAVKVWVRQYETDNFLTVPDQEGETVWVNSFDLPEWNALDSAQVGTKIGEKILPVLESETMPMSAPPSSPPSVRSVTIKFFKLLEHEQRRLISQMKLDKSGDSELKDYELVIAAVKRSQERGTLPYLDQLIDEALKEGKH
ncbi:metallophosphoesterase [Aminobacter sp. SR38]|uniref:metallophosphoesterase n=1 Tax=Aminobacter sp. SR38 TaxID=2774562 RepID=UPI00178270BF|nr:metallophosphoesterase [Aminobacter sp. SR38]QOF72504.1 metallophosphoesterase [Aminobacter sp. SR38]